MMRAIYLHGHLAERFGDQPFHFDVNSVAEAGRALASQIPDFRRVARAGQYQCVVGEREGRKFLIGYEELVWNVGGAPEIHFVPVTAGAKNRGAIKMVLGAVIFAAAVVFAQPAAAGAGFLGGNMAASTGFLGITYGNIALFGAAMALQGAAAMLSPTPEVGDIGTREPADQRASFLFSRPVNVTQQGHPVPLIFGRFLVGSVVGSSGISVEQI